MHQGVVLFFHLQGPDMLKHETCAMICIYDFLEPEPHSKAAGDYQHASRRTLQTYVQRDACSDAKRGANLCLTIRCSDRVRAERRLIDKGGVCQCNSLSFQEP